MKKLIAFTLALVMCLSLCACGGGSSGTVYKLGDTVSTDVFNFTLDEATFTYALEDSYSSTHFAPKEYNAQEDSNNPFVAPKGNTFVAITYTIENTDRAPGEIKPREMAVVVAYDGKTYKSVGVMDGAVYPYQDQQIMEAGGSIKTKKAGAWYSDVSQEMSLDAGEKERRRAYVDISVDVENLTDAFEITISVPNSKGKDEKFTYSISG